MLLRSGPVTSNDYDSCRCPKMVNLEKMLIIVIFIVKIAMIVVGMVKTGIVVMRDILSVGD